MQLVLLERERELDRVEDAVGEARAGRGGLLVVEGPPGIGKTCLLEALRARARRHDMVVLAARASELDREFPFGVVRQLFEPLVLRAEEERRARLLGGPAALVARLLGVGSSASDAADSLAYFHALYWLIANLADEEPVALVIDDAHWADAGSLRFLEFLAPRLEELPALVALAMRPHESAHREPSDALAVDALARVVRPAPLSVPAVADLVATELGEAPAPGFAQACHDATGGNPFLVRELVAELARDHVRPLEDRAPMVRRLAPQTVGRAVLLRLARLGAEATALAHAVAVLDQAPLRRAAALAGLAEEHAAELAG